jgi:hypothetical protein
MLEASKEIAKPRTVLKPRKVCPIFGVFLESAGLIQLLSISSLMDVDTS